LVAAASSWMVIGSSGVRTLSVILASFLVISGTIGVILGMDTAGKSLTEVERKHGSDTSPPAARKTA
jgi:hypothetical protein